MWHDRCGGKFTGGSKLQPVVPRDLAKEPALFPSSTSCSSIESFLLPRNLGFCKHLYKVTLFDKTVMGT